MIMKNQIRNVHFHVKNNVTEQVQNYNYLGTNVYEENDYSKEIRLKIEKARSTFKNMKQMLCKPSLKLRMRMLRGYVF